MSDDEINRIWEALDKLLIGQAALNASLVERCPAQMKRVDAIEAIQEKNSHRIATLEQKEQFAAGKIAGISGAVASGISLVAAYFYHAGGK